MSRIGRKPIKLPEGVNIEAKNNEIMVKGPKGELNVEVPTGTTAKVEDGLIQVDRENNQKKTRAFHGMVRSLLLNSVTGVTEGFSKTLEIVGTGYKAELNGKDKLKLTLGFSHVVDFNLPKGVTAAVEDRGTLLTLQGIDKQVVGETAANIRKIRKPNCLH